MKHTVEFESFDAKEGWLTYFADGKQVDVSGEFFQDRNGVYHHSHIFGDGTAKEITWK